MSSSLPCGHRRDKIKVGWADGNRWWLRGPCLKGSKSEISWNSVVGSEQEGTGSFTNRAGAINTIRKTLLCQGQTGFFISSCTSISLVGICFRLEGGENKVRIKSHKAQCDWGWAFAAVTHSFGETLQSHWLHKVLVQTPLAGLLRERKRKKLITDLFQLMFEQCLSAASRVSRGSLQCSSSPDVWQVSVFINLTWVIPAVQPGG